MTKLDKLVQRLLRQPPEADFADVRKVLEAYGYQQRSCVGSHFIFRARGRNAISIPVHGGKVKGPYVKVIIRELGLFRANRRTNHEYGKRASSARLLLEPALPGHGVFGR